MVVLFFIEFIGVILVNKTIQVSSVQLNKTSKDCFSSIGDDMYSLNHMRSLCFSSNGNSKKTCNFYHQYLDYNQSK